MSFMQLNIHDWHDSDITPGHMKRTGRNDPMIRDNHIMTNHRVVMKRNDRNQIQNRSFF